MGAIGRWDPRLFDRFRIADPESGERRRLLGELARIHDPLVIKLVKQLLKDPRVYTAGHIEWPDALGAGRLAFVRAMNDFDPEKGRLSTFLLWKILDELQRAAQQTSVVHRGRHRPPPEVAFLGESVDELMDTSGEEREERSMRRPRSGPSAETGGQVRTRLILSCHQANQIAVETMLSLSAIRRWTRGLRVHPSTIKLIELAMGRLKIPRIEKNSREEDCGRAVPR